MIRGSGPPTTAPPLRHDHSATSDRSTTSIAKFKMEQSTSRMTLEYFLKAKKSRAICYNRKNSSISIFPFSSVKATTIVELQVSQCKVSAPRHKHACRSGPSTTLEAQWETHGAEASLTLPFNQPSVLFWTLCNRQLSVRNPCRTF